MRAILDMHERIRCGPETRILPNILYFFSQVELDGNYWYTA